MSIIYYQYKITSVQFEQCCLGWCLLAAGMSQSASNLSSLLSEEEIASKYKLMFDKKVYKEMICWVMLMK